MEALSIDNKYQRKVKCCLCSNEEFKTLYSFPVNRFDHESYITHSWDGAVIGFDEVGDPGFPGETIAVKETFGIENISLRRFRYGGIQSYIIIE